MDKETRLNLTASDTWTRGIFMLFFMIVYSLAIGIWYLIVLFQFVHTLFVGKPRDAVLDFCESLSAYIYEILLYVSFSSQDRPFPFGPWPGDQDNYVEEQPGASDVSSDKNPEVTEEAEEPSPKESDVTAADSAKQDPAEDQDKV